LDQNANRERLYGVLHIEVHQPHGPPNEPSLLVAFLSIPPYAHSILVESLRVLLRDEGLDLQHTLRSLGELGVADSTHRKAHDVCHIGGINGDVATDKEGLVDDQLLVEFEFKDEGKLQEVAQHWVDHKAVDKLGETGAGVVAYPLMDRPVRKWMSSERAREPLTRTNHCCF